MHRFLRLKIMLPIIQVILSFIAVLIDQSVHHGLGEGDNQVRANLVSNIEFIIKLMLGHGDIVNYSFQITAFVIAIGVWYLVGLSLDTLIGKVRRRNEESFN